MEAREGSGGVHGGFSEGNCRVLQSNAMLENRFYYFLPSEATNLGLTSHILNFRAGDIEDGLVENEWL